MYLVKRRDEIRKDVMHNETLQEPQAPRRVIPVWADLLHDMVNYAREVGRENHSGEQTRATKRTPKFGMQESWKMGEDF